MNREYEFRGWHIKNKIMIDLEKITPLALAHPSAILKGVFLPFDDHIILMQYIGIKDIHGKKFFEGDLIKTKTGKIRQIIWAAGGFFSTDKSGNVSEGHHTEFWARFPDMVPEIIGNIHKNPEILELAIR
jgi:uncharacterized phage protein (TIGR01671 family)